MTICMGSTTIESGGRMIDVSGTFNFRDVGGRPTGDGSMMRSGVLYRSASLDSLDEDGLQQIEALGISTVLDLRSTGEVESHGRFPYEVVPVRFIHLPSPFGPPSGEVTSANLPEFAHDEDPMAAMFRMAVTQGSEVIGQSLRVIAEADALPLVFHCTSGKDRTGVLALLAQLVAGVTLEDALVDFERTMLVKDLIAADMQLRYPGMAEAFGPKFELRASAKREWIEAAIATEIGGLANLNDWFDTIGVDATVRSALRERLLV